MIEYSHAKVNLALDVLGKHESGFHKIQTILQEIPLMDTIDFYNTPGKGKFNIKFRGKEANEIDSTNNTVGNAIKVLAKRWKFKNDYEITVNKKIPIAAGLGGGSSNAATVITALNSIEVMKLTNDEMREIGAEIGIDVPFFIEGGSALGTNFGEKITVLDPLTKWSKWSDMHKLLLVPTRRQLTEDAFKRLNLETCGQNIGKTEKMLKGFEEKNSDLIFENIHNDFEQGIGDGFDLIKSTVNAEYILLCGSGTSILALSKNPFDVKALSAKLPNLHILDLNR